MARRQVPPTRKPLRPQIAPSPGIRQTARPPYEIMLTTLPNGVDQGFLKLSVVVSPQLKPRKAARLSSFAPIFTKDWPNISQALKFEVVFESGANIIKVPATPESSAPLDSKLWENIFHGSVLVRPHQFDPEGFSDPNRFGIRSFSEINLLQSLKNDVYQPIALDSPKEFPNFQTLKERMTTMGVIGPDPMRPGFLGVGFRDPEQVFNTVRGQLLQGTIQSRAAKSRNSQQRIALRRTLPRVLRGEQLRQRTGFSESRLNILEFLAFHQPLKSGMARPGINDWQNVIDFHQIVSSLSQYPLLMVRLGLRLDFRVKSPSIPAEGKVWIQPVAGPTISFVSPQTAYTLAGGFRSHSTSNETRSGLLHIGTPATFDVLQGDVEGAVKKAENFSRTLLEGKRTPQSRIRFGIPSLRSGGLSLVHINRGAWLESLHLRTRVNQQKIVNPGGPRNGKPKGTNVVLSTEDLIRGYRIDVREVQQGTGRSVRFGPWRSLCFRKGAYVLGPNLPPAVEAVDEGWVSLGVTKTNSRGKPDLVLYESLFRWMGWSLSVPRPGKDLDPQDRPNYSGFTTVPGINLKVGFFPVPGTLPRLRFGRQYQFRARVVDLAGNSLSLGDLPNPPQDLVTATHAGFYDRFEPVSAPVVVLMHPVKNQKEHILSPGESVERIVIRTANIENAQDQAALPATPVSGRHIAPPKVSQNMAEAHGMFDDAQSGVVQGKPAYQLMVAKDGVLSEVHSEPEITVPYLPDPMAAGATFLGLPGTAVQRPTRLQVFAGKWPDQKSFRLFLENGQAPPQFQNGILRAFLPPGEEVTIRVSSFLYPKSEKLFGIWRWMLEKPHGKNLLNDVRQGRHWMLTPFRELTLVHAVQQPLITPRWASLLVAPKRLFGSTDARLDGTVAIHRKSTEKIDIEATWMEPIDEGVMPPNAPVYIKGEANAFELPVPKRPLRQIPGKRKPIRSRGLSEDPPEDSEDITENMELEAIETESHFQPDGEEIPLDAELPLEEETEELDLSSDIQEGEIQSRAVRKRRPVVAPSQRVKPSSSQIAAKPVIPSSGPPPYDESQHRCASPPPPLPQELSPHKFRFAGTHRFGDTKYRCVNYQAVALTRYREYFFPFQADPKAAAPGAPKFTRESPILKVDILNSAPPAAPEPLYVVPTFKWEQTARGTRRGGGGLRVYLERPWFSSGDGEQLAVILYRGGRNEEVPKGAEPHVTQWGLDPLWVGSSTSIPINPGIFKQQRVVPRSSAPSQSITPQAAHPNVPPSQAARVPQFNTSYPSPGGFRNALAVRHDLYLYHVRGRWSRSTSKRALARPGPLPVSICAFPVQPDPSRQLWYCDIEVDMGSVYYPFIRLALARYQPNSIPGAHLSKVVQADFAQLVPDRSASVTVNQAKANHVRLTVTGAQGVAGRQRHTIIEVSVEEFKGNVPGELGWTPIPNRRPVLLPRMNAQQWTGDVPVPSSGGGAQHRLIIKEFEVFQESEAGSNRQEERRLVYADTLLLKP